MSDDEPLMAAVHRVVEGLFGQVDGIVASPLVSERAKRVLVARQYRSARAEVDALRKRLHSGRDEKRDALRCKVLDPTGGLPFTASTADKLLVTSSHRDALAHLRGLSRDEVFAQLSQWATVGDDIGVKACLAEGFRLRDAGLVNACTAAIPSWEADVDALWEATVHEKSEVAALAREELTCSIPLPNLLGGLSDDQIAEIADDGTVPL